MTRRHISEHFTAPYAPTPPDWPPHPTGQEVTGFLQHREFASCFVPLLDGHPVFDFFFCSVCYSWKRVSTSSAHIRVHFATATHNQDLFLQKHGLSPEWSDRLARMMVLLILTRGYAFSLIDDPIIQETIPNLMHSKKLKRYTSELAGQVRDSVRRTLKRCEYCSSVPSRCSKIL